MTTQYMSFVDKGLFSDLFQELGWDLPPRGSRSVTVETDAGVLVAQPVADQSGLKVWVCQSERLPGASEQRVVDQAVAKLSQVHLLIFTDGIHQAWRWPRRGATAATNTKLLQHHYTVGNPDQREDLERRLAHIDLPLSAHIGIAEIQERMAKAFNEEAVKRSSEASHHMETMNLTLLDAGCSTDTASSLLVRLLFLFFGDDTRMWPDDTFQKWVLNHTTADNFHAKLTELFEVLCDEELDKAQVAGGIGQGSGRYAASEYQNFRRIGGMYQERMELPVLPEDFRLQVLAAGEFDWGRVNPDIFGAMFQQLVDLEDLRKKGEHYTSEENIQKVLEPMFLDEYRQRFQAAFDDRAGLLALQDELAGLQFIDPACGSGNFLIQAYKHLRGLEYEIIMRAEELELEDIQAQLAEMEHQRLSKNKKALIDRRNELQAGAEFQYDTEVLRKSKLSMRQFYGIEINAWPAKVASTAMLLVDHLANQVWGENVVRLPIEETPQIVQANALRVDWDQVVPDNGNPTYVFGNPPFLGQDTRSKEQLADLQRAWGRKNIGRLDFVTAWHCRSLEFFNSREGYFAFVTTNSITQGEQAPILFDRIFQNGWKIKFAHRTFGWKSEGSNEAAVHCVIVGFTRSPSFKPRLWDYPLLEGKGVEVPVKVGISPYLIDGPELLVKKASKPISPVVSFAALGAMAKDGGGLVVEAEDYESIKKDPIAAKYLRPYKGSRELVRNLDRWCLWLVDMTEEDLAQSSVLQERIEKVRKYRNSSIAESTNKIAETPHLFAQRSQPHGKYLCIPSVVSENRPYFTAANLDNDTIVSSLAFAVEDPDGLQFALISSAMFIAWQRTVGGRLESRLRFASTLTWHTFPVPNLDDQMRHSIVEAGQHVLSARGLYPERSLSELYEQNRMTPELIKAHEYLDEVIDRAFGAERRIETFRERQEILFANYVGMTYTA